MAGILRFVLVVWALGISAPLLAEPFFDPTRPPEVFLPVELKATLKTRATEPVLVLESILLSPQRKAALINGRQVELGQRFGEYRLEALGSTYARLQGPRGVLTLKLSFPQKAQAPLSEQSSSLQGVSN